jgi:hypothetical protein
VNKRKKGEKERNGNKNKGSRNDRKIERLKETNK